MPTHFFFRVGVILWGRVICGVEPLWAHKQPCRTSGSFRGHRSPHHARHA